MTCGNIGRRNLVSGSRSHKLDAHSTPSPSQYSVPAHAFGFAIQFVRLDCSLDSPQPPRHQGSISFSVAEPTSSGKTGSNHRWSSMERVESVDMTVTDKAKPITRPDNIERSAFHLVANGFLDISASAQSCVDSTQIGVYRDYESVWQFQRDTEDVLQTMLTTPTNTKRNCGGTSAKLMTCVGVYTALRMRGCKLGWRVDRKR
jgi:hypothetical protein